MTSLGQENSRVGFIFTCMASHLCKTTKSAERGAATILAACAAFFRNRILHPHTSSSLAETVNAVNRKECNSKSLEAPQQRRKIDCGISRWGYFQRKWIDSVSSKKHHHNFEGISCCHLRAWFSQPSQVQSTHNLCHCNCTAASGQHKMGMTGSERTAV